MDWNNVVAMVATEEGLLCTVKSANGIGLAAETVLVPYALGAQSYSRGPLGPASMRAHLPPTYTLLFTIPPKSAQVINSSYPPAQGPLKFLMSYVGSLDSKSVQNAVCNFISTHQLLNGAHYNWDWANTLVSVSVGSGGKHFQLVLGPFDMSNCGMLG